MSVSSKGRTLAFQANNLGSIPSTDIRSISIRKKRNKMEHQGNEPGRLYILATEDLSRVGNCWMKGRLKVGDVILCIDHGGDYFNDYLLMDVRDSFIRAIVASEFGAYMLGTKLHWRPTKREFHLLCAGESISNTALWQELSCR
jgi:hypothetical protein